MVPSDAGKPGKRTHTEEEVELAAAELSTTQYLVETVKTLQAQNESLRLELAKARRIPSSRIALLFLIPGVLALAFSYYATSPTLAFIGLGLTFWGALFLFVRPVKYVKSSLLDSTAVAAYTTIDRIVKDLHYTGTGYYIPPYPKDVYLPEYLTGLKDMIVFIAADADTTMPSIEDMAQRRFLLESPHGISVAPPGLGLLTLLEKELKADLNTLTITELCESLPKLMMEDFQLAKEIEMRPDDGTVYMRVNGSTYQDLYRREQNLTSVHLLGCPLVSAAACAVAKVTRQMVTIQKDQISLDEQTTEVWLRTVGV